MLMIIYNYFIFDFKIPIKLLKEINKFIVNIFYSMNFSNMVYCNLIVFK